MAKFIKKTSEAKWNFLKSSDLSFLEILNEKEDCESINLEQEIEVGDQLLKECCDNFKDLKGKVKQDQNVELQRAGYFEKSEMEKMLQSQDCKYLRVYNGIHNNSHFIFFAAIDSNFQVTTDDFRILCTRVPPCPPKGEILTTTLNDDMEDIYYKK